MEGELFFEIPNDQEVMAQLVEAIPENWAWVDGALYAPEELITLGRVEENTGFAIRRFHSIHPTIVGTHDGTQRKKDLIPNLFAIIVEQKLPAFITFDEAGFEYEITLEVAKRIACGFIRKGYRGRLNFYRGCYDNTKYDNPARASMVFLPWEGAPIQGEEAGSQPARVRLKWESRYRGKEEDIAPIVAVCRSFKLREYVPVAPPHAKVYAWNR